MKARPILFSAPMIRALLAGCKTQTRRVVSPQPEDSPISKHKAEQPWLGGGGKWRWMHGVVCREDTARPCPYGEPGDLLWVRETWQHCHECGYGNHAADVNKPRQCTACDSSLGKWKPSIHMFREDSRLTLEITSVRVERLQAISEKDAIAEGVMHCVSMFHAEPNIDEDEDKPMFQELWESINGEASWAANPWVWVIEFKIHKCNVDALLAERSAA